MNDILNILQFVAEAIWNVWPLFLISISLSVLIRFLKLDGAIRRAFDANVGVAILLATLVGAFSPFCSCAVVPVIAGLLASGVPLAPIMAFWIASPTMDPEIFSLSVGVLGWPLALTRLGATLILSLAAGYITLLLTRTSVLRRIMPAPKSTAEPVKIPLPSFSATAIPLSMGSAAVATVDGASCTTASSCCGTSCGVPEPVTDSAPADWSTQLVNSFRQIEWREFGRELAKSSWELGRWLLLAFLLEALITRYVPQAAIAGVVGEGQGFAVPLAALIGIPLYLGNLTALPIVSGLLAQGMQPGAAIAFLIAGPVTTVPAMTAVYGVVERRVFILYLSLGLIGAVLMGLLANLILS